MKRDLSCLSNLLQGFFWLEKSPPAVGTGFPKIKVEPSSFSLNYEGTVPVFPAGGNGKLPSQSSLDTVYARKKMSQAERHRGWVKMRNVSSVKISIQVQVTTEWCLGHGSHESYFDNSRISFPHKNFKFPNILINSLQKEKAFFPFPCVQMGNCYLKTPPTCPIQYGHAESFIEKN